MIQPSLITLYSNEYNRKFHYYPFVVTLDRCVGSCNTLNNLSNKVCLPNKTEDLNIYVFDMITGKKWINNFKILNKNVKQKIYHKNINVNLMVENITKVKSGIMPNVDVSVKNIYVKKIVFGILLHAVAKMVHIYQYY